MAVKIEVFVEVCSRSNDDDDDVVGVTGEGMIGFMGTSVLDLSSALGAFLEIFTIGKGAMSLITQCFCI